MGNAEKSEYILLKTSPSLSCSFNLLLETFFIMYVINTSEKRFFHHFPVFLVWARPFGFVSSLFSSGDPGDLGGLLQAALEKEVPYRGRGSRAFKALLGFFIDVTIALLDWFFPPGFGPLEE